MRLETAALPILHNEPYSMNNNVNHTPDNNTTHTTITPSSNDNDMNAITTNPDPKQISKIILRSALQKANIAVQCDSKNDVIGAINSYNEAILLLEKVLSTVDKESDRKRLQDIHDSYSERIQLLSTITSRLDIDSGPESPFTPQDGDSQTWLSRPFNNTSNNKHVNVSFIKHTIKSPVIALQTSKSTPVKKQVDYKEYDSASITKQDEFIIHSPPRFSSIPQAQVNNINNHNHSNSHNHGNNSSIDAKSVRSSISSFVSHNSSIEMSEDDEEEEDLMIERPAMALPSLKQKKSEPAVKSIFRTRTSSLPKRASPVMTRSLSMNTIEKSGSSFQGYEHKNTVEYVPMRRNLTQPIPEQSMIEDREDELDKANHRLSRSNYINDDPLQLPPKDIHPYEMSRMKLLMALEKSMQDGAHISQKLYIPKNLWLQPNIRLSSMDVKVSACEQLMIEMSRLENWMYSSDVVSTLKLVDKVESSVEQLQYNLSKKLKRESTMEMGSHHNHPLSSSHGMNSNSRDSMSPITRVDSNGKKAQTFMSWSNKLSKSVERMNAFSLTKTEDQFKHYIETLQRLFMKVHILDKWISYYLEEKRKGRLPQHDIILYKLNKICDIINMSIGGFVIRDVTTLLTKWLKRGGSWVNE